VTVKNTFCKPVSFLLGVAALTIVSSATSAQAETFSSDSSVGRSEPTAAPIPATDSAATPAISVDPLAVNPTANPERSEQASTSVSNVESTAQPTLPVDSLAIDTTTGTKISTDTFEQANGQSANPTDLAQERAEFQNPQTTAMGKEQQPSSDVSASDRAVEPIPGTADNAKTVQPIPGTLSTSAASLTTSVENSPAPEAFPEQADTTVAQGDITNIEPGRPTRGGASYIAGGLNIGLGGDSALGDTTFAISSKIGLSRTFSFRPGVVIGDETAFLLPLTYDLVIRTEDPFTSIPFAPYIGGGAAVTTGGDVGFLLTGGVDVPLSRQFVANAAVNVDFGGDTNVGLFLGVGYVFPGFFRQ
jgi:hypothetical protein